MQPPADQTTPTNYYYRSHPPSTFTIIIIILLSPKLILILPFREILPVDLGTAVMSKGVQCSLYPKRMYLSACIDLYNCLR